MAWTDIQSITFPPFYCRQIFMPESRKVALAQKRIDLSLHVQTLRAITQSVFGVKSAWLTRT